MIVLVIDAQGSGTKMLMIKPRLEVDLFDDRLCHVFVLPCATVHLLELDTMQAEQWDLDNEDLKS